MVPPVGPPGQVTVSHRVGPFDITQGADELTLKIENQGDLSLKGCLFFASTMVTLVVIGVLSIIQTAESTPLQHNSPNRFFDPATNHFGFLWLFGSLLVLVGIPFYVQKSYQAALTYTFRRADDTFLRNRKPVTRLRKIEYFHISECKDPDGRYLYNLEMCYNDGQHLLLHNGYDERETMNLANCLASFVGCPAKFD
jgi:hypothetical protein